MLAAVLLPRRAVPSLAIVVALALGAASLVASREVRRALADRARAHVCGRLVDWIDAAGERDVALSGRRTSASGRPRGAALLERIGQERDQASWSRLSRCRAPGAATVRQDGALETRSGVDLGPAAVAAPAGTSIVGEELALAARVVRAGGHGPVASRAATPHVASDHGSQAGRRSPRRRSSAHRGVRLPARQAAPHPSREAGPSTRIRLGRAVLAERAIPPEAVWRVAVPTPANADGTGRCVYVLETDGLIGSTRIEFVPRADAFGRPNVRAPGRRARGTEWSRRRSRAARRSPGTAASPRRRPDARSSASRRA